MGDGVATLNYKSLLPWPTIPRAGAGGVGHLAPQSGDSVFLLSVTGRSPSIWVARHGAGAYVASPATP
jgi:hypothetical protein